MLEAQATSAPVSATLPTTTSFPFTGSFLTVATSDSYRFEVDINTSDQNVVLIPGENFSKTLNVTCSATVATTISYSMAVLTGYTVPTWGTLDTSSGVFIGTAPASANGISYGFQV